MRKPRGGAFALMLLAGVVFEAGAVTRCVGPQPGAGVQCPRICVEYETELMRVGESQTVSIVGGVQPYRRYNDSGWETFELKPLTHNQFTVIATRRTQGSGGTGWAQFMFEDARRCVSGRVEFRVEEGRTATLEPPVGRPANPPPPVIDPPLHPPGKPGAFPPSLSADVVLFDEFDGVNLDSGQWEGRIATGRGTGFGTGSGDRVFLDNGILALVQGATDRGGAVVSKPIPIVPGKVLKISKETHVHYANDYYTGATAILGQDPTKEIHSQVGYNHYVHNRNVDAFTAGYVTSGSHLPPLWDTWFMETITYDPATGLTTLAVNDGNPVSFKGRAAAGVLRIGLHGYGWYTGHNHRVASLKAEWVDAAGGPPPIQPPQLGRVDLNGIWNVTTDDANHAFVIVYQEGSEVRMMCAFELKGRMVAWHSQGSLSGNQVKSRFHITSNTKPAGWENDGSHDLVLSPDGNTLSGTGRSQSGFSYAIRFQRVK